MKTVCLEKAWEENGDVKCEYDGVVLSYRKEDVLRIEKRRAKKPAAEPADNSKAKKETVTTKPGASSSAKVDKSAGLPFYDPRRTHKYWTSETGKHKTFHEAVAALAKQYERSPDWVKSHMGATNDLTEIRQNLTNAKLNGHQTPDKAASKQTNAPEFYNPRRKHKYWTSETAKHNTFGEAVAALAKQYERSAEWVKSHMRATNDIAVIHQNLRRQKQQENSQ